MTSTPVNVQGFVTGSMYGTNRVQGIETKGDFSKIFESQKNVSDDVEETGNAEKEMPEDMQMKETKKADDVTEVNQAETEEKSTTVNETQDTEKSSDDTEMNKGYLDEEQMERAVEVLSGAIAGLRELLMQQLGISEEELNSLMQELDLSDVDLLQMGNVKELVLQAVGAQDMTALLTDEELYSQMKNIEAEFANIMQDVRETLELEGEEVFAVADQMDDFVNVQKNDNEGKIFVDIEADTQVLNKPELTQVDKNENAGKEQQNPMQEQNAFTNQPTWSGNTENIQTSSTSQIASYATVETENIMRQIMDHMRIQLTAETTELDMQLQPETLGTLQIKISAKEGVMTAQFTTASETVKGMLESQMVQLQQQFDQQNIKVEAIEVTVQAHAFESALEKGNEHQASEEETRKNRTRRIDLGRLEGTEELETEEQLLAEMMEANGNTVDYLV